MNEIEISAYCYSEKEDVGIGFGVHLDAKESLDELGTDWIDEGISDSFWENAFEFDSGIEKAQKLNDENPNLTYRQALYSIFGDFTITYKIDEKEVALKLDIDANQAMYDLLMEL